MSDPVISVEDRRRWTFRGGQSRAITVTGILHATNGPSIIIEGPNPLTSEDFLHGAETIRAFSDLILEVEQWLGTWPGKALEPPPAPPADPEPEVVQPRPGPVSSPLRQPPSVLGQIDTMQLPRIKSNPPPPFSEVDLEVPAPSPPLPTGHPRSFFAGGWRSRPPNG